MVQRNDSLELFKLGTLQKFITFIGRYLKKSATPELQDHAGF